jgi:hypothetical protein
MLNTAEAGATGLIKPNLQHFHFSCAEISLGILYFSISIMFK